MTLKYKQFPAPDKPVRNNGLEIIDALVQNCIYIYIFWKSSIRLFNVTTVFWKGRTKKQGTEGQFA